VISRRGLGGELITRPEKSYRLLCDVACDLVTSSMRRTWPTGVCRAKKKENIVIYGRFRKINQVE
jgi:hypothetical protein